MPAVLLVVTSHTRLGTSDQSTGAWLEELAQAYYAFADADFEVAIASPAGGEAPLDPASVGEPWLSAVGQRFLDDPVARGRMRATLRLAGVRPSDYASAYFVGGAGAALDLPTDPGTGRLIEELVGARKPVAAVCHGAAALAAARNPDGTPLIHGRAVTAFSNVEEEQVGYVPFMPVLPENLLRSLGAHYRAADPWTEHVVVDGLVMSGQNPASAGPLARAVVERLRSAA